MKGMLMPPVQSALKLNDGHEIPRIGFGTGQLNDATNRALGEAIGAGYRLIDTAARYRNEERVGATVRAAAVPRETLFITTKIWPDSFGFDRMLKAFDASLARLRLDSVDFYLLHWPAPWLNLYVESWRALIRLREEGRVKSIGVANFDAEQIQRLADETGIPPAVNQVELHPHFQQAALRTFHAQHGIATGAWSPLGQGRILGDRTLAALAKKYGKTPAQIVLRWHYQNGVVAIPKSADPERIRSNIDIFDFELGADDMAAIGALDNADGRIGADPDSFPR
jgi:2,5-diketo-D-gluconate reductase A